MRFAIGLEYAGTHYHGWQTQPIVDSVQAQVERALSLITGTPIAVQCAGRTDKGVHATYQVCHFDSTVIRDERTWIWGTNAYLPRDIRVMWVKPVPETFHARYQAKARRYRYVLFNAPHSPALLRGAIAWDYRPLNVEIMHAAAQHLLGEHDFSTFRGAGCQSKTPIRSMIHFNVTRTASGLIVFDVMANAFLLHMVRNMVGALLQIGSGAASIEWIQTILAGRDRRLAAKTASEAGLYLADVLYPESFNLPRPVSIGPWFC